VLVLSLARFLRQWEQREATLAFEWGVDASASLRTGVSARPRPKFRGVPAISPIDGHVELAFGGRAARQRVSHAATGTAIVCVLAALFGIFGFKHAVALETQRNDGDDADVPLRTWGPVAVSSANSLQIIFMNKVYSKVAHRMAEYENWRTSKQHADALMSKVGPTRGMCAVAAVCRPLYTA
jgi:hypothetical protein